MFRALAVLVFLASCTQAQVDVYQQRISEACATVLPLAGLVPSVGVYAVAACSTEAAIAKLTLDPTSYQWLLDLKAKLTRAPVLLRG